MSITFLVRILGQWPIPQKPGEIWAAIDSRQRSQFDRKSVDLSKEIAWGERRIAQEFPNAIKKHAAPKSLMEFFSQQYCHG